MERWLNLKRKNSDVDDEKTPCTSKEKSTKLRKYDSNYLSMGFTSNGSEEEPKPQCVVCFEVLSNEALKPSKLKRHLETKHKEHAMKSIDFFKNKEQELRKNMKFIKKTATDCTNESAVKASFIVSLLIGKSGKPHTIAEDLILPAAKAMVSTMIGEEAANSLNKIALSNDTIQKRIDRLSGNIKEQLLKRINKSDYFSLQLDESTDITNKSVLLCYVRYEYDNVISEDILFVTTVVHTTAEEIFCKINEFIIANEIEWTKCVGVSTDGARAMSGKFTGLIARIRNIIPSVTWHHCCIHREAIVSKKIPIHLKTVLDDAVKIVNFIKAKSLNSRIFEQLCKDMDSEHYELLLHSEIRWLSRGKVLSRLFELKDEVRLFFIEHKSFSLSERMNDYSWLATLAYLSDIFTHLNALNLSLQGTHITIFKVEDKIEAMIKKLELWSLRLSKKNYDPFPNLKNCIESTEEELSDKDSKYFIQHMGDMQRSFRDYFPVPDISRNWIRQPFEIDIHQINGLTSLEEDSLVEMSTDTSLKMQFNQKSLEHFWLHVRKDYPQLSSKALKVLIPFPTTYLCEKAFSALVYIKNKFRNRLENVESELRLKLSSIEPDVQKLVTEMQHQPSH